MHGCHARPGRHEEPERCRQPGQEAEQDIAAHGKPSVDEPAAVAGAPAVRRTQPSIVPRTWMLQPSDGHRRMLVAPIAMAAGFTGVDVLMTLLGNSVPNATPAVRPTQPSSTTTMTRLSTPST